MAVSAGLVASFAGVVYARARSMAHGALEEELRFRSTTLAAMLEVLPGGEVEFEVDRGMLPDFEREGAWLTILDERGKAIVLSPNLAGSPLPSPGPWTAGPGEVAEIDGPGGVPAALLTRSIEAA
ncbi:MAG: hypothetical protein HUU06_12560, partial [Planctomycetaceae bacterium]|nr:hypothetical protein [Planctomycetaceae bacterium]